MAQEELTNADVEKIEAELEHRKTIVRKEAIEAVKVAKRDKNIYESRFRYLERMLKTAKFISDESKEDEVGINNTVTLYFEEDDETEVYKLVTSIRGDSLDGRISIESPIGKAILGHKAGDRVQVKISDTAGFYVVIKAIENTTDTEDDTIRTY